MTHDGFNYIRYYYDDNGNLVKEFEGSSATATTGQQKTYTYDDFNRLTKKVTDCEGSDLYEVYTYDIMGNVTSTSQHGKGTLKTSYTYDDLGRMLSMTTLGDSETYTYNIDGTIATKTDRNGTVFTYSYRDVYRKPGFISAVNGEKTQSLCFYYDKMGNLTFEGGSDEENNVTYTYDFLGRLVEKDHIYVINTYTYDSVGNKTSLTLNRRGLGSLSLYPEDSRTFTYDAMSRLTGISAFGKTGTYTYDNHNQVNFKALGELRTTRTRNTKGLVTNEHVYRPVSYENTTNYYNIDYGYNYKGNLISEYNYSMYLDIDYTYDGADRLTEMGINDNGYLRTRDRLYGYDNNGNLTEYVIWQSATETEEETWVQKSFSYSAANRINSLGYIYDIDGNRTGFMSFETDDNSNRTLDKSANVTYDLFNRMTSYTKDGVTTTYTYTASGLRESKTANGVQTFYAWDDGSMILEYVISAPEHLISTYKNLYAYGADGLAYRKTEDGTVYTYVTNYRGDVLSVMDENLDAKFSRMYDAYGVEIPYFSQNNFAENFGYRGQYHDPESGYIYLRNRYLDPTTGRFTTEDPIRDGLNWFAYCEGNPIMFVDPSGYITEEEQKMYENGEMAPMAFKHLMNITFHWYLADDQTSRDVFHQLAEEFRATNYTTTKGQFPGVDEGIAYMPSKPTSEPTKEQHYFRNQLNLEFTWKDFQKLQKRLPPEMKWVEEQLNSYHQHNTVNNNPNRKYVSYDGHFELVYNDNNELQTIRNNPADMGTFNYASSFDRTEHALLDVKPYGAVWIKWGNIPEHASEMYK